MQIEHIALWTDDLERLKTFYEIYFQAQAGNKYTNPLKGFASYFLSLGPGARLEIMQRPGISPAPGKGGDLFIGYTHLAIAVGSANQVDALTARLRADGYPVLDGPRRTGDGYYESVVLDPDGNRIEITI